MTDAQGIMLSGEFDTMLVKDPEALTVLTALYNTHEHNGKWKNTLKGSGVESLLNPCISLLVASNEVLFEDAVKAKDVEGGFLARTFIVHESKRRNINPLIDLDPDIIDTDSLIQELTEISKISGEFKWSEKAKAIYRPWYHEICTAEFDDKTGAVNRLGDSVLKVAMLINLAGRRDLVIHGSDLQLAIDKCQDCMQGLKTLTRSTGIGDTAPYTKKIIELLLVQPDYVMARDKILRKVYPDVDALMLDKIIDTLNQAEALVALRDPRNKIAYRLTPKAIKMFTKFNQDEES